MSFTKSIVSVTTINIGSALIAVLNSILVARIFGTSREIEIYFATNVLIYVVMKLSQGGEMSEVLLPLYHKFKIKYDKITAQKFVSVILNWYIIAMVVLSILVYVFAPGLVRIIIPGFTYEDHVLGTKMIRVMSPALIIMFSRGQINSLLNAENHFGKPEMISAISRMLSVVIIIIGFKTLGIWVLILSLWVSSITNLILLLCIYSRAGNKYYLQLHIQNIKVIPHIKSILSTLPYIGATQFASIVFNAGLSTLPQGSLAVFNYSLNFFSRLRGIFLRPIATVFFTHFSIEIAADKTSYRALINRALELIQTILFPALIIVMLAGKSGLMFLWYSERFGLNEINLANNILTVLFIMLFLVGLDMIARKIVMSLGYVKICYSLLSISQILYGLYVWYGIKYLGVNGAIIAMALSGFISLFISLSILFIFNRKHLFFYKLSITLKWLTSSSIAFVVLSILNKNFISLVQFHNVRLNYFYHTCIISFSAISITIGIAILLNTGTIRTMAKNIINKVKLAFI